MMHSPTTVRILRVINYLMHRAPALAGPTEIAENVGLNRVTVQMIINTMHERGYVIRDGESRKYGLGMKFALPNELETVPFPGEPLLQTDTGSLQQPAAGE